MEFQDPSQKDFTIYSKSGCPNCTKVKKIIKEKFFIFHEINCDNYLIEEREKFISFIENKTGQKFNTFPLVFYDGEVIGGYNETIDFIDKILLFDEIF
jgi:glutaredoxin